MQLEAIRLSHFRNYQDASLYFPEGVTILAGENAQGKTNLIEAVNYLSCLKSFRGAGEAQLRGYGADPRPAPPLTVCVIFEIHIDRSGPVAQVGMVDVLKISHTRYPHGRRLFWPSGGSSPGCPVLGQGSLPAAALPDAGAAPLAAGIRT